MQSKTNFLFYLSLYLERDDLSDVFIYLENCLRLHLERTNMHLHAGINLLSSKCKVVILAILLMVKNLVAEDFLNVNTSSGLVKGFESKSGDIFIYVYKNIPYAKQPVGDLRFEVRTFVTYLNIYIYILLTPNTK